MTDSLELKNSWDNFISKWQLRYPEQKQLTPDPDWPSPCETTTEHGSCWQPVGIEEQLGFDNVEQAIELELDKQFCEFFTLYFADNIDAQFEDSELQFLQAWSKDDFIRLQQNLIGHLLMKKKLKQTPTLFFALTDEEDLNLVVNNHTGQVCLEYVGKEPHKIISDSLAEFINLCEPS